jgi:cell wall-associated NlpC family hydrolase
MRSRIPVGNNADISKAQKTKGVVKGAVKGAQGKNVAGAAAGGQVTGAIAGAAQAVLSQTKTRTLAIWALAATGGPFIVFFVAILIISFLLGNAVTATVAGADQAALTSSGASVSALQTLQNVVQNDDTPWTILEATIYYETGVGQSVAQQRGVCPTSSETGSLCPATLDIQPGTLTAGGGSGGSNEGSSPGTSAQSGFDPSVGRNGTVPTVLAATSPDWTSTDTADWDCIRQAESGDNYNASAGAYGVLPSTWASLGLPGTPGEATKTFQDSVALEILNYEGHFYGAWNDLCTDPTSNPADNIAFIPPGVADPSGSGFSASVSTSNATSNSGTSSISPAPIPSLGGVVCPKIPKTKKAPHPPVYYGPYCLLAGTSSTAALNDLTQSSELVAKMTDASFSTAPDGDAIDLTEGVSVSDDGMPIVDEGSSTASTIHADILSALATLPIEHNSTVMDENIYELATSWANGYSPISTSTCSASGGASGSTSITGPSGTDLLSPTQVALADQIVNLAASDGASESTQIAAVDAALALSNLSTAKGIFDDNVTSVSAAVSSFATANANSTASPDAQAVAALGGSISTYTGWIGGATQLVSATSSAVAACGSSVPEVPGGSTVAQAALTYAKSQLGVPYVWGGETPGVGFDCSGLVQWSFGQAGATLPRTAEEQLEYVQTYSTLTTDVADLQPGDLVFFSDNEPGGANHVAIYLGDGNIIQAPETGQNVSYDTLADDMSLGFLGGGPAA